MIKHLAVGAALLCTATQADACPPPDPSPDQVARRAAEDEAAFAKWGAEATDIVYGIVTRGMKPEDQRLAHFKVLYVYRGNLKPGQTIRGSASLGPFPLRCNVPAPGVQKGTFGVIAFKGPVPQLTFASKPVLAEMFNRGWIKRASQDTPTSG